MRGPCRQTGLDGQARGKPFIGKASTLLLIFTTAPNFLVYHYFFQSLQLRRPPPNCFENMRQGSISDFTASLETVYSVKMAVLSGVSFVIFAICFVVKQYDIWDFHALF